MFLVVVALFSVMMSAVNIDRYSRDEWNMGPLWAVLSVGWAACAIYAVASSILT